MSARTIRTPKYRLHKPSGLAVVTLNGKDVYLGSHGSQESQAEYRRLIAEWLTAGRLTTPTSGALSDLTVSEFILAYLRHAETYYRKNGKPTQECSNIKLAVRPLRRLYGHTIVREFGPLALKAVRRAMVESDLCRTEVNKRVRHIVRMFRWGVENETIPPAVHQGLKAVPGLKRGRSEARESEPVKPVPDAVVDAVGPHVTRQVWAMVQLQRLTGMRPGEVTIMRTCDIDRTRKVWVYTPESHKTQHHGKERTVPLGPRAKAVLGPWLQTDETKYLFSPRDAVETQLAERRQHRKSPMTPSQASRRRVARRKRPLGSHYTTQSYGRAIATACKKANVQHWHPHQLRHNAATMLRKEFGLDVARVVLGHSSTAVTEIYAEVDREKAMVAMEQVG